VVFGQQSAGGTLCLEHDLVLLLDLLLEQTHSAASFRFSL
jgi:hypothetical protein